MIESGLSESLSDFQGDAAFWLTSSGGDMNIVLLISICAGEREYTVEKWELIKQASMCLQEIRVHLDCNTVVGAPLRFSFDKIFLRAPVGQETDIVFTDQKLLKWGQRVWTLGYRE